MTGRSVIQADHCVLLEPLRQPSTFLLPRQGLVSVHAPTQYQVTTLLRQLLGVEPFSHGQLYFFGKPADYYRASGERQVWLRTRFALIQAGAPLLSVVTALQNVIMPVLYHGGMSRERAMSIALQWLEYVGFEGDCEALPSNLTALQRMQVAIARALALSPAVIGLEAPWKDIDTRDIQILSRLLETLSSDYLVLTKAPITPILAQQAGCLFVNECTTQWHECSVLANG